MKIPFAVLLTFLVTFIESNAQTNFVKITDVAPVTELIVGTGCAWVDYDQDGYVDLFVADFDGNNHLYHNERNGTFVAVTNGTIVNEGASESYGVAWGDFDNDGYPDLFVSNGYDSGKTNFLYRNNGNGTFTKITSGPIVEVSGHFTGCAWADYDRDGFLDLFVANDPSGASVLYHNEGGSTFSRVGSAPTAISDAVGVAWADFNKDGWPDLFVANGFSSASSTLNFLYANQGGGTFQRVLAPSFSSANLHSVGVAWGDYDNDGFPDVFVTNIAAEPGKNELYHNNGNGTFTRVTTGSIYTDQSGSVSASWGDYDNDGWLDLFVGNRNTSGGTATNGFLYHNNGNGTFTRITNGPIAELQISTGGCGWGDYDNDGFLDLFVSDFRATGSALFHNTGNSNHWLKVKCEGTASNRSGIGARVRVKATSAGKTFWQLREITSGDGFGNSALIAHFGLGDATNIDTVRIEWPSGTVQEMSNVTASQFLTVTEPAALKVPAILADRSFQFSLIGGVGFRYDLQTSDDLVSWAAWKTLTCTNRTMTVTDTTVIIGSKRFYRAVKR